MWSYPSAVLSALSFGDSEQNSAYTLYVTLVTNELYHVHAFLQQSFDTQSATERVRWQTECKAVDARLLDWRAKFGVARTRLERESGGAYDANVVLTLCALDLYVPSLLLLRHAGRNAG